MPVGIPAAAPIFKEYKRYFSQSKIKEPIFKYTIVLPNKQLIITMRIKDKTQYKTKKKQYIKVSIITIF